MIPLPNLTTLLATTTTQASEFITWGLPLVGLVLVFIIAPLGLVVMKRGIVRGAGRLAGRRR